MSGAPHTPAPPRFSLTARRLLARLWGAFPSDILKTLVVWVIGPRFVVNVIAVIFDDGGRVLLFEHTHDRSHPWGLPSGRLERGEQPVEALSRELREEVGVTIEVGPLVALIADRPGPVLRAAYLASIRGGRCGSSAEVTEARYFTQDQLPPTLRPYQRDMIETARRIQACMVHEPPAAPAGGGPLT